MMRLIASIIILFLSVVVSPWILAPIAVLHALAWFGLELIFIAAAIDAYFGTFFILPYYTLAAILIVGLTEFIKPHLSFYAE